MTEPTLRAWGIPYDTCRAGDDPGKAVERLLADARAGHHPTALLFAAELS
jgi:hypothetical protein